MHSGHWAQAASERFVPLWHHWVGISSDLTAVSCRALKRKTGSVEFYWSPSPEWRRGRERVPCSREFRHILGWMDGWTVIENNTAGISPVVVTWSIKPLRHPAVLSANGIQCRTVFVLCKCKLTFSLQKVPSEWQGNFATPHSFFFSSKYLLIQTRGKLIKNYAWVLNKSIMYRCN